MAQRARRSRVSRLDQLRFEVDYARETLTSIVSVVPPGSWQSRPGVKSNAIAAVLFHVASRNEAGLTAVTRHEEALARPLLPGGNADLRGLGIWERQDWDRRLPGVRRETSAGAIETWQDPHVLDPTPVRQYEEAVYHEFRAALDRLSDADLDRRFPWFAGMEWSVQSIVFTLLVAHTLEHAGEISGLLGAMGDPGRKY